MDIHKKCLLLVKLLFIFLFTTMFLPTLVQIKISCMRDVYFNVFGSFSFIVIIFTFLSVRTVSNRVKTMLPVKLSLANRSPEALSPSVPCSPPSVPVLQVPAPTVPVRQITLLYKSVQVILELTDIRLGTKAGEIGLKWDKSGTFLDQNTVHSLGEPKCTEI